MGKKHEQKRKRHQRRLAIIKAREVHTLDDYGMGKSIHKGDRDFYIEDEGSEHDAHHLLFERDLWENDPYCRLRNDYGLIAFDLSRQLHKDLHREVSAVPPLGRELTRSIARQYFILKKSSSIKSDDRPEMGAPRLMLALDKLCTLIRLTDMEMDQIDILKRNLNLQLDILYGYR